MNCKAAHTIMGNLMLNFKRIFAFVGNMEKILHALCIPSGSEILFLCRSCLPACNRNVWKEKKDCSIIKIKLMFIPRLCWRQSCLVQIILKILWFLAIKLVLKYDLSSCTPCCHFLRMCHTAHVHDSPSPSRVFVLHLEVKVAVESCPACGTES